MANGDFHEMLFPWRVARVRRSSARWPPVRSAHDLAPFPSLFYILLFFVTAVYCTINGSFGWRTILTSAICASKEYFSKAIGHVKTCSLSYGPNGVSRGIATIVFSKHGDAEKAAATYNGVLVDKRPMKV